MRLEHTSRIPSMDDARLLEELLTYTKQSNAQETAKRILYSAGSLANLLHASTRDLESMGLSFHTALLLSSILPIWGRVKTGEAPENAPLVRSSQVANYLYSWFCGCQVETACLLLLREDFTRIATKSLGVGSVNAAQVGARAIVEEALFSEARYVILAHNHPVGTPLPSREDVLSTERILQALDSIRVPLLEHYVVTTQKCLPILYATGIVSHKLPQGFYDEEYPHITPDTLH